MGLGCQSGPKVVPNGSSENYRKVSNGHVIEHVLVGQNRGSIVASFFFSFVLSCLLFHLNVKH